MTILYLGLVVLWAVAMRAAEYCWPAALLLYIPQHVWLVLPALLLLIALVRRNRRVMLWNLASLWIVVVTLMGFHLPKGSPYMPVVSGRAARWQVVEQSGTPIRVMTYNMHHASKGLERIAADVKEQNPDIVCLQEANTGDWSSELPREMESLMSGWHITRFRELATLSKYPVLSRKVHRMQERTGRAVLETAVDVDGRHLTVLNTHLSTATKGSLLHRSVSLGEYVRNTVATRSAQMGFVQMVAQELTGSVVIMGDFNNPPRGVLYHRMLHQFDDAFGQQGLGFGYTYNDRYPVLRIDYVFVDDSLDVKRCFVPRASSSDHLPVVADLVILDSERKSRL